MRRENASRVAFRVVVYLDSEGCTGWRPNWSVLSVLDNLELVRDCRRFLARVQSAQNLQGGFLKMSYFGMNLRAFLGQIRDFRTFFGRNM